MLRDFKRARHMRMKGPLLCIGRAKPLIGRVLNPLLRGGRKIRLASVPCDNG